MSKFNSHFVALTIRKLVEADELRQAAVNAGDTDNAKAAEQLMVTLVQALPASEMAEFFAAQGILPEVSDEGAA